MTVESKTKLVAPADPTAAMYGHLGRAYTHFNDDLFDGKLPPCLLGMHRNPRSLGYYHGEIFQRVGSNERADELALNPQFVSTRPPEEVYSTLVHEMCHHWQKHFGKEPSRAYHDKEWGNTMESVGLMPSDTGAPGGKRVGQHMSHYIIVGGRFAVSCAAFLAKEAPVFYQDRAALRRSGTLGSLLGLGEEGEEGDGEEKPAPKSKGRATFICPTCELKAYAKPSALLICGTDNIAMEREDGQ